MSRRSSLTVLSLAAASLLVACGQTPETGKPDAPAEVGIVTLRSEPLTLSTELPGRTSPFRIAEVRPQVGGILQQRLFEEGRDVKAGQALYQIDPAPFAAAVESARGSLASAEAGAQRARLKAERYQALAEIKAVSQQEAEDALAARQQADAAVTVARAALTSARINLGYARISAPIGGRIGKSTATPGALLTANQATALTTVQQLDPIYVDVTQSSSELMRLRRALDRGELARDAKGGAAVSLQLEDGSTYALTGTLQFSDVTVDPSTSTVTLRALFPNPRHELLPGLYVRARLSQGLRQDAVLVPQRAVTRNPRGEATALVLEAGDTVVQRTLALGQAVADRWLVLDGLKAGDRVIVDGLQKVKPGAKARPVAIDIAAPST